MTNLKKGLIALGASVVLAAGIVSYFTLQTKYLTYEEMIATIEVYNRKLEEIRADCRNDTRCFEENGIKKVRFNNVKNKKDFLPCQQYFQPYNHD